MASYKVIQDIEAEDKLLGPLTLRQFIYAIIVVVCGFAAFKLITIKWYMALPFLPPIIFFTVLAAPFGHDQSSEVWLLAKVRFFLKPRRRIWDQSGLKELVTITAPKKIEKHLTNELSQTEVRSRLQALANTIDSRGWAAKNINVNLFSEPAYIGATDNSDRLLAPSSLPQDVPTYDVQAADDMLDEQNSPTAQNLNQMMATSTQEHKQEAISRMKAPPQVKKIDKGPPADYWFLREPVGSGRPATPDGYATFTKSPVVIPAEPDAPVTSAGTDGGLEEQALLAKIHAEKGKPNPAYGNMRTILPPSDQPPQDDTAVTDTPSPAIIQLANNDDLSVATIARQAKKANKKPPNDEVVVKLH